MKRIYFDNASTSWPKAPDVASEMAGYLENTGCNVGRGSYGRAYEVSRKVYETREKLRCLFDAEDNKNVIFTANVTQAINMVLKGFLKPGDHVLISGLEHNAVVRPLEHLRKMGASYDVIPCDALGNLKTECIESRIKPETRAVVMTHGSNVSGGMLPIEAVGKLCAGHGLYFIVDTAQTAGLHGISMKKANISALCFTGHKGLMGPQGIGGFLVTDELAEQMIPLLDGGTGSASDRLDMPDFLPDRFEAGTLNLPGIYGLSSALDYLDSVDKEALLRLEEQLTGVFIRGVEAIGGLRLIGSTDPQNRCALVSVDCREKDNAQAALELDRDYGIMVRVGMHCAPLAHRTLGTYPQGTLRFSFSHFNTLDEVARALEALQEITTA
ncbi:aminotransferase class V-fold PLP-dependent enzyme [Eubacterium sp. 1001713B170207_170306_E7]|uniref:aminotransferase class V-fold PLP-dependent enzyme n=1 Tax=Eubacterium sp. 1001713B170207_170306_E7 TaxID=2787097 RepID=UPI0018996381|nr:aminotransferase class V-fold PLP-dependent enzyme [Eubacterium sp. 1001713B170207_170306_E7]